MKLTLSRGYTLIELLVVILIISIVAGVAVLSIGRSEGKQVELFVNELRQILSLAEDQAMLQPAVLGLSFTRDSMQFYNYQQRPKDKKYQWVPSQDSILSKRTIPHNIQLTFVTENKQENIDGEKITPQVVISTSGNVTPFTIYIGKKGENPRYVVTGDADGNVTSKLLS